MLKFAKLRACPNSGRANQKNISGEKNEIENINKEKTPIVKTFEADREKLISKFNGQLKKLIKKKNGKSQKQKNLNP